MRGFEADREFYEPKISPAAKKLAADIKGLVGELSPDCGLTIREIKEALNLTTHENIGDVIERLKSDGAIGETDFVLFRRFHKYETFTEVKHIRHVPYREHMRNFLRSKSEFHMFGTTRVYKEKACK